MPSDLLLTAEEVRNLTGYKKPSLQIRKLREYGVRFFVAADGHPRIARSQIEGGTTQKNVRPNFAALEKLG